MENFVEYCLPYRLTAADQIKRVLFTVLPILLGIFFIMFLGPLGILLCAVCCYVAYRVLASYNYELEYTFLEDEITFTKIINKERRRELMKADLTKTECYGPIDHLPAGIRNIRSFLSHQGEEPEYFWITHKKNGEKVCILFQPDERIRTAFAVRARGKER